MERKNRPTRRPSATLAVLIAVAVLTGGGSVLCFFLDRFAGLPAAEPLAITLLTFCYHLSMRLIVGESVTVFLRGREISDGAAWFRERRWERGWYRFLRLRKWAHRVLTAKPEQFDASARTPEELLRNMAQAEIVHEICMVLSFLPLLLILPFGAPWAFLLTSLAASLADGIFVAVQRYNRPILRRYLKHLKNQRRKQ